MLLQLTVKIFWYLAMRDGRGHAKRLHQRKEFTDKASHVRLVCVCGRI